MGPEPVEGHAQLPTDLLFGAFYIFQKN